MDRMKPLRVLFLAGRDPAHSSAGGGDIQAWAWAVWMGQKGHSITFVAQSERDLAEVEIVDSVRILRMGHGLLLPWRAWRHYRRENPGYDLIYEDPIGSGRVPYLSPLWSRTPVVAVWHQVSTQLLRVLYPRLIAWTASMAERILAMAYRRAFVWIPSEERAREIVDTLGFDEAKIRVIPPTISPATFSMPGPRQRDPVVVFLGVLRRYKTVGDTIKAMQMVVNQVPEARLVIAGRPADPKYVDELTDQVKSLLLSDNVTFEFGVTDVRKLELLRNAAALVLPSVLEGFGIVTLEANAVGTPAIVSSGVPMAAVQDHENGRRYPYGDVEALADVILEILSSSEKSAGMGRASIAHARRFTPDAIGAKFDELAASALNRDTDGDSPSDTR